MAYIATVLQVMIASPSDVSIERQIAQDVIQEWNVIHCRQRQIVLTPKAWETHATPLMGDRPQAIINKQVLHEADILIGIFWTRLGTPTGRSASGTVEEIQEHLSLGRPTMLYFSTAPAHLDTVDNEQYQKLKQFISECRQKGLIETYSDISEFREKLSRQLALLLNDNDYIRQATAATSKALDESNDAHLVPMPPASEHQLSDEAIQILIAASQDKQGIIMALRVSSGYFIKTNGQVFGHDPSPRIQALWKAALEELANDDCIEPRGVKGEIFAITNKGYEVADFYRKNSFTQ